MRPRLSLREGDDVRALWIAAFAMALAAYAGIFAPYQRAIARSNDAGGALLEKSLANEATLARAPALRHLQGVALRDLQRIAHDQPSWEDAAQLLTSIERLATACDVVVSGVQPEANQHAADPAADSMRQSDLTLTVRGRFANVLRFVEALSRERMPIRVNQTELAPVSLPGRSDRPLLAVTIHATLFRIEFQESEDRNAATR